MGRGEGQPQIQQAISRRSALSLIDEDRLDRLFASDPFDAVRMVVALEHLDLRARALGLTWTGADEEAVLATARTDLETKAARTSADLFERAADLTVRVAAARLAPGCSRHGEELLAELTKGELPPKQRRQGLVRRRHWVSPNVADWEAFLVDKWSSFAWAHQDNERWFRERLDWPERHLKSGGPGLPRLHPDKTTEFVASISGNG